MVHSTAEIRHVGPQKDQKLGQIRSAVGRDGLSRNSPQLRDETLDDIKMDDIRDGS